MNKKLEAAFAAHVRKHLNEGDELLILGRKVKVLRIGYYDGACFDGGVVIGLWDERGRWREYRIPPAQVPGMFDARIPRFEWDGK